MGVQRAADDDPERAFALMEAWAADPDAGPLVLRAVVAAVCEPRLLRDPAYARRALRLVRVATDRLAALPTERRRDPDTRTLRQALGYCWSVAIAALPEEGLTLFAELRESEDADVAWVVRENLKKKRLARLV